MTDWDNEETKDRDDSVHGDAPMMLMVGKEDGVYMNAGEFVAFKKRNTLKERTRCAAIVRKFQEDYLNYTAEDIARAIEHGAEE
jgi:hypothetical protein